MQTQDARDEAIRQLIAEARQLTVLVGKQFNPELARSELTIASAALLRSLAPGPATVPDLARRLLMSRQATQRFVDELAEAGRLHRVENPRHARSPLYALTAEGHRAVAQADRAEAAFLAGLALEAPVAELQQAARALERLARAVHERTAPGTTASDREGDAAEGP